MELCMYTMDFGTYLCHTYGPKEVWGGDDILFLPDGFKKSCKSAIGRSNDMRLYCVCLSNCKIVKGKPATFREKIKNK